MSKANLAQFGPNFGIGKFFLFVFGQNQKSGEELLNGPVVVRRKNEGLNLDLEPCLELYILVLYQAAQPECWSDPAIYRKLGKFSKILLRYHYAEFNSE